MTYQTIGMASDRVLHSLATGSGIEDRRTLGDVINRHILAAEEADFYWDGRLKERWLGANCSADGDEIELDRVAIVGRIDGRWFATISIIDGDGMPHGMTSRRTFHTRREAEKAFEYAR
ncbi:MAG: hypothetical protein NVS3B5_16800 [Sphingomicrobium sp.]